MLAVALGITRLAFAAEKKEARVTQVIRDVRLLASDAAPRPASLNDSVREGTAVRTGSDSRAELTFFDQTLTRLGANTVFSFGGGRGNYDLKSGAVLMSVPRSAGPVRINTAVAAAAVTGFVAIYEYHAKSWSKFLILEVDGRISLKRHPGESKNLHAGQIIIFRSDATKLPEPQYFNICRLIETSPLIAQFPKLPTWARILSECQKQQA